MKKIVLIYLISMMLIFLPIQNTQGAEAIYTEDWEEYNDGVQIGNGTYLNIHRDSGTFEIDNTKTVNSGKYLYLMDGATGFINLTDDYTYIKSISLYSLIELTQTGFQNDHITFTFFDSSDTEVLRIRIRGNAVNTEQLQYYDSSDVWHTLVDEPALDDDHKYYINITHSSGNEMTYSVYDITDGASETSVTDSCRTLTDWETFKYIQVTGTDGGNDIEWSIDDFVITLEPTDDSASACTYGYDFFGTESSEGAVTITNNQYLEWKYDIPMTITINAFEVYMNNYLNEVDVEAYINGISIGNPDDVFERYGHDVLQWCDIDISLSDEEPVFELYQPTGVNNVYFKPEVVYGEGVNFDADSDGDGNGWFQYHNTQGDFGDGEADGDIYTDGVYTWTDICYKLYYTYVSDTGETGGGTLDNTNDHLSFSGLGYTGIHPSYSIPSFYEYSNVVISYSVQTLLNDNVMHIYHSDTGWTDIGQTQGYPMTLDVESKTVGFVPLNTGNYTVTIVRNGAEVCNETFFAYELDTDYHVYTIPSVSLSGQPYRVHYIYNNTKDGELRGSPFDNFYDDDSIYKYYIEGGIYNGEYIVFNSLSSYPVHYWQLFVEIRTDSFTEASSIHEHYVRTTSISNYVETDDTYQLNNDGYVDVGFEYCHGYIGGDVRLKVNDNVITDSLGNYNCNVFTHRFTEVGTYNASMEVYINDSWWVLDYTRFTVIDGEGGDTGGILPQLDQPLGSIVGFIIVGFSLLMPFIIAGSIGKTIGSNIQVPPLVYGFFGALGISISVIIGCFPTWIVFFIVAMGVIIVALTYLLNLRQQGVV